MYPRMLRWALVLHDIAKDRHPRCPGQREEEIPHPEESKKVAEIICKKLISASKTLGEYHLDACAIERIIWLVENHDVLGNIFTGEREPRVLLERTSDLKKSEIVLHLRLLQVLTLCDVRATAEGKFLTEKRARNWLSLVDPKSVKAMQSKLYRWRVQQWTGDLLGVEDRKAATYVAKKLRLRKAKKRTDSLSAEQVFGDKIKYIVYGFYLFTALCKEQLAGLIALITDEFNKKVGNRCPVDLVFQKYKPWESATKAVLQTYEDQISRKQLNCTYDESKRRLTITALGCASGHVSEVGDV